MTFLINPLCVSNKSCFVQVSIFYSPLPFRFFTIITSSFFLKLSLLISIHLFAHAPSVVIPRNHLFCHKYAAFICYFCFLHDFGSPNCCPFLILVLSCCNSSISFTPPPPCFLKFLHNFDHIIFVVVQAKCETK